MADNDAAPVSGRGFDHARRERIKASVRARLRPRGRPPQEAEAIVARIERCALGAMRRPGETRSDRELASPFPLEVCKKARALGKAVRPPKPQTLLDLIFLQPGGDWRTKFPLDAWSTFSAVLGILADAAPPNKRQPNIRLRFLEFKVLGVLRSEGLFAKTNQDVADILAECKEHLGLAVNRDARARVAALRRAVRNLPP